MAIFDGNVKISSQVKLHPGLIALVNAIHTHNMDPLNAKRQLLQTHPLDLWATAADLLSEKAPRDFICYVYSDGTAEYYQRLYPYGKFAEVNRKHFEDVARGYHWPMNGVFYVWNGATQVLTAIFATKDHSHVAACMEAYDKLTTALQWPTPAAPATASIVYGYDDEPATITKQGFIEMMKRPGHSMDFTLTGGLYEMTVEHNSPWCSVTVVGSNTREELVSSTSRYLLMSEQLIIGLSEYFF